MAWTDHAQGRGHPHQAVVIILPVWVLVSAMVSPMPRRSHGHPDRWQLPSGAGLPLLASKLIPPRTHGWWLVGDCWSCSTLGPEPECPSGEWSGRAARCASCD
jgi:hypothetical protein